MKAYHSLKRTPLVVSLVTVIVYIDTHSLHPFLASYAVVLGATPLMSGLIIAAYSIFEDVFEMPAGYVMDKLGRRKQLLIVGAIMDAISMFVYSLCRTPQQLLLARILHGVGGALAGPAMMSLVADVPHPLAKMGARMGVYGASIGLSVILGWLLGGFLVTRIGYVALFYTVSGLLLAAALLTLLIVEPEPFALPPPEKKIVIRELIGRLRALFSHRAVTVACYAIFMHMMTMGALVTLLSPHFAELGLTSLHVGLGLAVYGLCWMVFQIPFGILSDKIGRKFSFLLGFTITATSLIGLSLVRSFGLIVLVLAIYGTGYALIFPTITALLVEGAKAGERALASGAFHVVFTQGVVFGAPLFAVVAGHYGYPAGFMASSMASLSVIAIILLVL